MPINPREAVVLDNRVLRASSLRTRNDWVFRFMSQKKEGEGSADRLGCDAATVVWVEPGNRVGAVRRLFSSFVLRWHPSSGRVAPANE